MSDAKETFRMTVQKAIDDPQMIDNLPAHWKAISDAGVLAGKSEVDVSHVFAGITTAKVMMPDKKFSVEKAVQA